MSRKFITVADAIEALSNLPPDMKLVEHIDELCCYVPCHAPDTALLVQDPHECRGRISLTEYESDDPDHEGLTPEEYVCMNPWWSQNINEQETDK